MTIAVSGEAIKVAQGSVRVTCTGDTSLIEINQDATGWIPMTGGEISSGVIPAETSFSTEELGGASGDTPTYIRFTGSGTVSYSIVK